MPVTAVIGDIHGCIKTLDRLINAIEKRFSNVHYISLGDIIDRGPGICDVIKLTMELEQAGRLEMVRGNHEDVFIDFIDETNDYNHANWLTYGGRETLACISGSDVLLSHSSLVSGSDYREFAEPYMEFLKSADFKISREYSRNRFMFSHAGIGPSRGVSHMVHEFQMRPNYLFMWSRDTWHSTQQYFGYTMVHGHTPVTEVDGHSSPHKPFVNKNGRGELVSISLDTGCVYGYSLSAMIIDEEGGFDFISERNCE